MTKDFTNLVIEALDKCAPTKKFKINSNYKHDPTQETKELIKEESIVDRGLPYQPGSEKNLL